MKRLTTLLISISSLSCVMTSPSFAQITDPTPYCNGEFDDMSGAIDVPDQINKVSFGTLSNSSNAQSPLPHYIYYNNLTQADFTKDSAYTLSVDFDVHGSAGYGVWIDYNHDNDFSSDEKVSGSDGTNFLNMGSGTVITETVTIPSTALSGATRMRVRIVEDDQYTAANGADILPCNASTSAADVMDWGETEDYNVNIVADTATNGIQEINKQPAFTIYPNPVQSVIKITTAFSGKYSYKIYNIMGKLIFADSHTGGAQIDVSQLTEGIYFMRLFRKGKKIEEYKFIKNQD